MAARPREARDTGKRRGLRRASETVSRSGVSLLLLTGHWLAPSTLCAFTALLGSATPLPKQARISNGWLAVSVRGPGETDFTALAPRLLLNAAASASPSSPAAGSSCAHDHFGEVWEYDYGIDGAAFTVRNQAQDVNSIGISGYSFQGFGVWGDSHHGFAMGAMGNAYQYRFYGGWVKAMAYVAGTSITRCYNSQISDHSLVAAAPCGFTSSGSGGVYTVDFGFQVSDRFITVTPHWGASPPSASVASFPTANSVTVKLSADSAFFIIIY